jgi:hypothetical protein
MIKGLFKRLWNDKRGNALVIAGAALPLVVGSAGLASDTIQWTLWKRQIQRAADSAALAGVYDRVYRSGSTSNVATAVNNDLTRHNNAKPALVGTPVITYPSGTNWFNPVRVELNIQQTLGFSSLFIATPPTITARATAATVATGVYWCGADLLPFTVKQEDPYKGVNIPPFSACQGGSNKIQISNPHDIVDRRTDTGVQCVSAIDVNGTLKLGSATYIIDGGNFDAGAQAKISCTGCTIILTNSDSAMTPTIGSVDIKGGAEIKMTAPSAGTFDGILFYQDRRAPKDATVNKINGNSDSLLGGAFYFPNQQLQINGTAGLNITCGQFVSYIVEFAGDGSINNTCAAGYGDNEIMGRHVRLVA